MDYDNLIEIMAAEILRLESENAALRRKIIKYDKKYINRSCGQCQAFSEKGCGRGVCMITQQKVKAFERCNLNEKF